MTFTPNDLVTQLAPIQFRFSTPPQQQTDHFYELSSLSMSIHITRSCCIQRIENSPESSKFFNARNVESARVTLFSNALHSVTQACVVTARFISSLLWESIKLFLVTTIQLCLFSLQLIHEPRLTIFLSTFRENLHTSIRNKERLLKLRRSLAVHSDRCPVIGPGL